ncbi:thioredoxin domain-containing protein [Microbacterium sp. G2-8]|uniref:DsbA family protein n=1 Tax=Microbacterium sp. G2-8 TaxID=2842454 RepID=UPI001C8A723A|nr:thioredoxin domain-containing protein [Microbacterium sp. G2-8]
MTTDQTPETPEEANVRRDAVREKAKKVKTRISAKKYARRAVITILIVAAVVAAGWYVWTTVTPEVERPLVTPDNITDDDGIDVLQMMPEDERPEAVDDPIAVDVYVDYMSPDAGTIEETLAPQMYELVDEGIITLTYHPLSVRLSSSQYSARAAGAVMCVVSNEPTSFRDFNTTLLVEQPEPETDGYTDEELASMASDAGADVESCITSHEFTPWVAEATDRAEIDGDAVIIVDGQRYEGSVDDPAEFSQFMLTVQSEQYYGETDSGSTEDSE